MRRASLDIQKAGPLAREALMRRREFIALIGTAGLPVATSAQNFEGHGGSAISARLKPPVSLKLNTGVGC